ncbi:MAG: M28 family peptidase [Longimicrobiales bacterium]|nr:M28 family peptidase [Longimicrobiales bacterium]
MKRLPLLLLLPRAAARTRRTLPLLLLALGACGDSSDLSAPPELVGDRPRFPGVAARALVDTQVAFGPRVPGTEGHAAQLAWMVERLRGSADSVEVQAFSHTHSETGQVLALSNVLARFRPGAEPRLLFLAHWDTRPTSDAADTPERRALPVPGANDGGSGTAVLLEVARILGETPPPVGVDILLVDGEDFGPTTQDMFLGARHFARALPAPRPRYGVLLDMVGDATPSFPREGYSVLLAPEVTDRIWNVAHALGFGDYFPRTAGQRISDDHIPLNQAGLPTANVIDFDYGPGNALWHTPEDLPEHVRAETLGMVGELVLELIYMGG